jgi:hyperosmotically inducible protein
MRKSIYLLTLTVAMVAFVLINVSLYASMTDDRIEASAKQSYVFRSLAQETVASLPGVKSGDNKLTVKGEAAAAYSDAWLITKVKFTLLLYKNVSATGTEVLAKDGTITLRGEAASTAQKDLTTEYAKDVDGVKDVKNEMIVSLDDDASNTGLVKTTLPYHRSTSALKTTVETNEGVVMLKGEAKNAVEKDLAAKLVNDVHGVKSVKNQMPIEDSK